MSGRPPRVRWQRLGLMVLVVGLAVAGLASQPAPRAAAPALRLVDLPLPRPATGRSVLPAAPTTAPVTAAEDATPSWPAEEPARGDASIEGQEPAERRSLAPDVVVAFDWPDPAGRLPFLRVSHAHTTDSAQPVVGPALPLVDAVMGSGDGIEGFEPGTLYWFGPRGLEKLQSSNANARVSMEAQR
jgi:hypothetical protein